LSAFKRKESELTAEDVADDTDTLSDAIGRVVPLDIPSSLFGSVPEKI
jgi:hypothetical protein